MAGQVHQLSIRPKADVPGWLCESGPQALQTWCSIDHSASLLLLTLWLINLLVLYKKRAVFVNTKMKIAVLIQRGHKSPELFVPQRDYGIGVSSANSGRERCRESGEHYAHNRGP